MVRGYSYFIIVLILVNGDLVESHTLASKPSSLSSNSTISIATASSWERAITDMKLIHSDVGVPIDFSYNETNNEKDDKAPSVPGCPKSNDGFPWVYYGSPPRCYLAGTRGPCPAGKLLFGNGESPTGVCNCTCSPNRKLRCEPIEKENSELMFCKAMKQMNEAIFTEEGNCIFLETQGQCKEGEWMVKDEAGFGVTCIPECSFMIGPLSTHTFDYKSRTCKKKPDTLSQPISLTSGIGSGCEDGSVFSNLLNKCIPKLKAYFIG